MRGAGHSAAAGADTAWESACAELSARLDEAGPAIAPCSGYAAFLRRRAAELMVHHVPTSAASNVTLINRPHQGAGSSTRTHTRATLRDDALERKRLRLAAPPACTAIRPHECALVLGLSRFLVDQRDRVHAPDQPALRIRFLHPSEVPKLIRLHEAANGCAAKDAYGCTERISAIRPIDDEATRKLKRAALNSCRDIGSAPHIY